MAATQTGYRIGAVARLTGISPDTLRVWERRYRVVKPPRNVTGNRLYSDEDIARLMLVKSLVDRGQAISSVASLEEGELRRRLENAHNTTTLSGPAMESSTVVLVGEALSVRMETQPAQHPLVNVVARFPDLEAFLADPQPADTLVVEVPFLDEEQFGRITAIMRDYDFKRTLFVYAFGNRSMLDLVDNQRTFSLRAPVGLEELWLFCSRLPAKPETRQYAPIDMSELPTKPVPAKKFSPSQLARIAGQSRKIKCECPQHLSDLILSLSAFEEYSLYCEHRNPADKALHEFLHQETARARSLVEGMLDRVASEEGIQY